MATLSGSFTLQDYLKRSNAQGRVAKIIEQMAGTYSIVRDLKFTQCNEGKFHLATLRTSYPTPQIRIAERGTTTSKSGTKQVMETSSMLEDRMAVDVVVAAPDKKGVMASEAAAHLEGFTAEVARLAYYGNTTTNLGEPLGLAPRYNTLYTPTGIPSSPVVLDGGEGGGSTNSIWLIGHGAGGFQGIYEQGFTAGFNVRDLPDGLVDDGTGLGQQYVAHQKVFSWHLGFAMQNYRHAVRIANVNSDSNTDYIPLMHKAKSYVKMMPGLDFKFYMNTNCGIEYDLQNTIGLSGTNIRRNASGDVTPNMLKPFGNIPVIADDGLVTDAETSVS